MMDGYRASAIDDYGVTRFSRLYSGPMLAWESMASWVNSLPGTGRLAMEHNWAPITCRTAVVHVGGERMTLSVRHVDVPAVGNLTDTYL